MSYVRERERRWADGGWAGLLGAVVVTLGVALLWSSLGHAQSCTVSASSVGFGSYDPFASGALDTTGQVDVACTSGLGYTVSLDAGTHSSGSFAPRRMQHATLSAWLTYNLYRNAARSEVWGDGTGATYTVGGTGAGLASPTTHTVYGRLPGSQNVHVGQYDDTLTVTVTY